MLPLLVKDGLSIPFFITLIIFFVISHKFHSQWNIFAFIKDVKYLNSERVLVKILVSIFNLLEFQFNLVYLY